jgi:hypothetical protein
MFIIQPLKSARTTRNHLSLSTILLLNRSQILIFFIEFFLSLHCKFLLLVFLMLFLIIQKFLKGPWFCFFSFNGLGTECALYDIILLLFFLQNSVSYIFFDLRMLIEFFMNIPLLDYLRCLFIINRLIPCCNSWPINFRLEVFIGFFKVFHFL